MGELLQELGEIADDLDEIRHGDTCDGDRVREAAAEIERLRDALDVEHLAQIIRIVDGDNTLGAAALAEAILPMLHALTEDS